MNRAWENAGQSARLSITFLITFLLSLVVSFLLSFWPGEIELPLYANLLLSQGLLLLPSYVYLKKNAQETEGFNRESERDTQRLSQRILPLRGVPRRRLTAGTVLCLIGLVFVLEPLLAFVNYVSSVLFGNATTGLSSQMTQLPVLTNILFVAILPAWCEEMVFRGMYYQGLRRHGFWKAALVSGLFFGLMHMNWNQFSYGFLLGLLFPMLIEATGSIYASMLVHFGINFQSVTALASYQGMEASEYENLIENSGKLLYGSGKAVSSLVGSYLFLAAALSFGLCALLVWGITKLSERTGYMRWVFWGGERRHLETLGKEPLLSLPLILAIAVPAAIMCILQIL